MAVRLSVMYFLQFAVFGAQTILLAGHMRELGFDGAQISWVYATGAVAALVSPVIAGWLPPSGRGRPHRRGHTNLKPAAPGSAR